MCFIHAVALLARYNRMFQFIDKFAYQYNRALSVASYDSVLMVVVVFAVQ